MTPYLVFSVGLGAVNGYSIAWGGRRIHQSKFGVDAVGNRVLWRGPRIVRKAFDGGAVGRDATQQSRRERGMSCGESPGCTG